MSATPETTRGSAGGGRSVPVTKLVLAGIVIVLAAWFILANTGTASIRLWVADVSMPMWIMLLVTFLAGWLVGALLRRLKK